MELREQVFSSLDNALENGYDNLLWVPAEEIAADLGDYDADLAHVPAEDLVPLVQDWRLAKGLGL